MALQNRAERRQLGVIPLTTVEDYDYEARARKGLRTVVPLGPNMACFCVHLCCKHPVSHKTSELLPSYGILCPVLS